MFRSPLATVRRSFSTVRKPPHLGDLGDVAERQPLVGERPEDSF
jgi:hypothetical protein